MVSSEESSSEYVEIVLADIKADPDNARKTFDGIQQLSESIAEHGLLENLVVRPHPFEEHFVLISGERRFKALQLLETQGKWDKPVLCLVFADSTKDDRLFINLTENVCRKKVKLWELGFRFNEIAALGYTQQEIGARAGTTQAYVSRAMQIAQGLAPKTITILNRIGSTINQTQLSQLASMYDRVLDEPDEEGQLKALDRMLSQPKRFKRDKREREIPEIERVYRRYRQLSKHAGIPPHAEPYVRSILRFLSGKDIRLRLPNYR